MSTVIKVENLSKLYSLKDVGAATIKSDIRRFWAKVRGQEDPAFIAAENNDRSRKGSSDFVWSLKDVNFEVQQGEVLGILGKNGAGKSTLLKILSRVAAPTTGEIKIRGRLTSLLEVGTGFHPDLSGRENIFLNGAILGMTKAEIKKNFDEIVDFSGVERYIDTPVKRYSSGMYVRLAFAVAAHLDPEILIIDEVLAVGDAEFQRKCIGKMQDASRSQGKTVLFVSHNISAIKSLCTKALYLKNGTVQYQGEVGDTIEKYMLRENSKSVDGVIPENASVMNTGEAKFTRIELMSDEGDPIADVLYKQKIRLRLSFNVHKKIDRGMLAVKISTPDGIEVCHASNLYDLGTFSFESGPCQYMINIENTLLPGNYTFTIGIAYEDGTTIDYVENVLDFAILRVGKNKNDYRYNWVQGFFNPKAEWTKLN